MGNIVIYLVGSGYNTHAVILKETNHSLTYIERIIVLNMANKHVSNAFPNLEQATSTREEIEITHKNRS